MKVVYDPIRQRVIATGLDQQIKFFEIFEHEGALQLRLQYKVKLPGPVFTFAISSDGNHYIIGLMDGSLFIKSKHLEEFQEEQDDEMKMIMNAFQPQFKSTSKNYKYFYRGQYAVMPDTTDIVQSMKTRKQKLQKFEHSLKQFQYKKALNQALEQNSPEVVYSLFEELIQRSGALEIALANRSESELMQLLNFISWKINDYRYQEVLLQVLRFVIDMYSGVMGNSPQVDELLTMGLLRQVSDEVQIDQELLQLKGQIDLAQKF